MLLVLAGCSGGGDTEPSLEPEPVESTPTGPTPQPEGADGVTWEIQNWDEYAEDEAVLAWKQTNEAHSASINQQELLPAAREGMTREALRPYLETFEMARDNDWTIRDRVIAKIESVENNGGSVTLIGCSWFETVSLYRPDGEPVQEFEDSWSKETVELEERDGRWVIISVNIDGTCDGGAPS